jgi:hypothetical protein
MATVNWNDTTVDIKKRKVAFVKWLMHKGESLEDAKLACYRKFYHEERSFGNIAHGRMKNADYQLDAR